MQLLNRFFIFIFLSSCFTLTWAQNIKPEKPNFLIIMTDDQSFNTIQALGNNEIKTPNLDKLAEEGVNFSHCFNQGSWSGAVCVASRTMLITGQTVFRAQQNKSFLVPWARAESGPETEVKLLGETFLEAGYTTYLTGKWHNSDYAALKSFEKAKGVGLGMYETFDQNNSEKFAYDRPKKTSWTPYDKKLKGHWSPEVKDLILDENANNKFGAKYVVSQHTSEFYSDAAINFLYDQKNETQPFLALVCYNAPHDPRQSPKEFVDQYPVEQLSVPANYLPEHPFDQGDNRVRDELLAPFPRTEEAVKLHKSEYYAIISHMDREIGRILTALEKSDQADNTYVILTSDHGLAVGSHGLMGKQNQYDHSVRMPFIIRGPDLDGGKSIDNMIYMQSIYATVCELAGIGVPETVEYPSLVNLLDGEPEGGEEYVFGAYLDLQRMIRNKKYKLIVYPKVNEVQLFDLEYDPDEMNDLAENKKYKSIKKDLFEAMKRKQEELGDFLVLDKI